LCKQKRSASKGAINSRPGSRPRSTPRNPTPRPGCHEEGREKAALPPGAPATPRCWSKRATAGAGARQLRLGTHAIEAADTAIRTPPRRALT